MLFCQKSKCIATAIEISDDKVAEVPTAQPQTTPGRVRLHQMTVHVNNINSNNVATALDKIGDCIIVAIKKRSQFVLLDDIVNKI